LFETASGTIRVFPRRPDNAGAIWALVAPPAFVTHGGIAAIAGNRPLRADIAWAGAFYAIVDSESAGVALDGTRQPELRRAVRALAADIEARYRLSHPEGIGDEGLSGVVFTGPARTPGAEFRTVTLTTNGRLVRGVSAAALAALMAVLQAMGLPVEHEGLVLEGPSGQPMAGRISAMTSVGDYAAIVPEIEAAVWPTGEHTFVLDDADPLPEGLVME
jgi:4-hydroxyproline epimerase